MRMRAVAPVLLAALCCAACAPHPDRDVPGTLSIGRYGDSSGLDPSHETDRATLGVVSSVFQGLVRSDERGEPQADAARSWVASSDGRTWTFTLRSGLRFSDGTPLDAAAVVVNFAFWRSAATGHEGTQTAPTYERLLGRSIAGVVARGPLTVAVHLAQPVPLLADLALPPFGLASPAARRRLGTRFALAPVGSGPYEVAEWERGDRLTLRLNPYSHAPRPAFDTVIVRVIPDPATGPLALEKRDVLALLAPPPEEMAVLAQQAGVTVYGFAALPFAVSTSVTGTEPTPDGDLHFERWRLAQPPT